MADYQEESDSSDEVEDDGYQDSGEMSPTEQGSDHLPPLERLHEYSVSENNYNRQMVGRSVVETLRMVHQSPADVERVMAIIEKMATDSEAGVRGEMMEHLPHIMMVCTELGLPTWPSIVNHLLPIVVTTITDSDNQVRKTAQTALLVLMEQNLIGQQYVEEQLCPVIVSLTHFDQCADYHPSIVAEGGNKTGPDGEVGSLALIKLMSKMAPLLGSEVTELMFVPRFTVLCSHTEVAIRKTCATNFGDFCAVINRMVTETQLLPRFCELARDSDWGVRKACAEVIMSVSCACCLQTRKAVLAQVFDNLLSDVMRWVRVSAFQTLGPFITTFAEPSITGLAYNQQGELVLTNPEGFEFRFGNQQNDYSLTKPDLYEQYCELMPEKKESQREVVENEDKSRSDCQLTDDSPYDSFLYWREPIQDIDSDLTICDIVNVEETQSNVDSGHPTETESTTSSQYSERMLLCTHLASHQTNVKVGVGEWWNSKPPQDIVPQPLIDHFVSMSDPSNASITDIDMAHHCAFSLPAVALTLGPRHWHLLRDTHSTLASDRQWKVRRSIASSIHELAVILGEEMATQDLVPIFSGLIKDLDEVRIGALRHLSYFLRLLRPSGRNYFLPRLADFLKTEYDYNWRFRDELAKQLIFALPLYSPADTCVHLTPIGIALLLDNVAAVRQTALDLVTQVVKHVSVEISLLRGLLAELAEQFAHSARWNRRQTFALLCSKLVRDAALADEMFARDVLPHLLDLSWDPVPNVRLAVARTVSNDIMDNQYFCNEHNPHHEVLVQALRRLQNDKDKDVQYFALYKMIKSLDQEVDSRMKFSST